MNTSLIMRAFALLIALTSGQWSTVFAVDPRPYRAEEVHFGDYVTLSCSLQDVTGKPVVYLAQDSNKMLVLKDKVDSECYWMILGSSGSPFANWGAAIQDFDGKVRLEHVKYGGRVSVRDTSVTLSNPGGVVSTDKYSLADADPNVDLQIVAANTESKISGLIEGAQIEVLSETRMFLSVASGRDAGVMIRAGAEVMGTSLSSGNTIWSIGSVVPMSHIAAKTTDDELVTPTETSMCLSYFNIVDDATKLSRSVPYHFQSVTLAETGLQYVLTLKKFIKQQSFCFLRRVADTRFFNLTFLEHQRFAISDKGAIHFEPKNYDVSAGFSAIPDPMKQGEWVIVPDEHGMLMWMHRATGGYLCVPRQDWSGVSKDLFDVGHAWVTMSNPTDAVTYAKDTDALKTIILPHGVISTGLIDQDDLSTVVYDPAVNSPFTPLFSNQWFFKQPSVGKNYELSFDVQFDSVDGSRAVVIALSSQANLPGLSTQSFAQFSQGYTYIMIDRNGASIYKGLGLNQMAELVASSNQVTTLADASQTDPNQKITFSLVIEGATSSSGNYRNVRLVTLSRSNGKSLTVRDAVGKGMTLDPKYFGLGGQAQLTMFSNILVGGVAVANIDPELSLNELVTLSPDYKRNISPVLIGAVAVGSRPVSVKNDQTGAMEQKGLYMAWAIGKPGTDYAGKVYQWKLATEDATEPTWVEDTSKVVSTTGASTSLPSAQDVAASSDGKVFVLAGGAIYRYQYPASSDASGTWLPYSTQDTNGATLTFTKLAVGHSSMLDVSVTLDDGTVTSSSKEMPAIFALVDKDGMQQVYKVPQGGAAEQWRAVGDAGSFITIAAASNDLMFALSTDGLVQKLSYEADAAGVKGWNWYPLIGNYAVSIPVPTAVGDAATIAVPVVSYTTSDEAVNLINIAVGSEKFIYGTALVTVDNFTYVQLLKYTDFGWAVVENGAGKDISGVVDMDANAAGSMMVVDAAGNSYRADEFGVTFMTPDTNGQETTTTSADPKDIVPANNIPAVDIINDGKSIEVPAPTPETKPAVILAPAVIPGRPLINRAGTTRGTSRGSTSRTTSSRAGAAPSTIRTTGSRGGTVQGRSGAIGRGVSAPRTTARGAATTGRGAATTTRGAATTTRGAATSRGTTTRGTTTRGAATSRGTTSRGATTRGATTGRGAPAAGRVAPSRGAPSASGRVTAIRNTSSRTR